MDKYQSAGDVAQLLRPDIPVLCLRPHAAQRAARWFVNRFPGQVLYAVKANPAPEMLAALWAGGVRRFDVASLAEVKRVRAQFPDAELALMHPVKSFETIERAYHDHGVRTFSLDSDAELAKILDATGNARDLTLCVRLAIPNSFAKLSLGAKFGVGTREAPGLLLKARQHAQRLGLCFHVGSQAMDPKAYVHALDIAKRAIVRAGVVIDVFDVGGGFPSIYPGMVPPPLDYYFEAINRGFEAMPVPETCELWCEPGRALVAEATSLLVRVEARRGHTLYINDGTYGALFDAGTPRWVYPTRLIRDSGAGLAEYSFYGPTCDDMDHMAGPFLLPDDAHVGDYIEIGQLGAYGAAMKTAFNGFDQGLVVEVADEPEASAYQGAVPDLEIAERNEERF